MRPLTGLITRHRLATRGVAVVRRFVPDELVASLRSAATEVQRLLGAGESPDPKDPFCPFRTYREWNGVLLERLRLVVPQVNPALDLVVAAVEQRLSATLRAPWRLRPDFSVIRWMEADRRGGTGWHNDAEAAGTAATGAPCINVWTHLHRVGDGAPSLEILEGSHAFMASTRPPLEPDRHRSDDWVRGVPGRRWIPVLDPGDVLLFSDLTLHRTPQGSAARTSCEFRFVGA